MRAIIVDDEPKGLNLLNELISSQSSDIRVVALARDANEGIRQIRHHQPDVVFLDINMPGKNGFEMLQELSPASFDVVFITAYDQYAIKAFKYNAFDYLLKPLDPDELYSCIERLREKRLHIDLQQRLASMLAQIHNPQRLPDRLTIHSMDGITVVPIREIIYLEAAGTYTIFYLKSADKIISSVNLKEYEELLSEHSFFRVHHSFLVNLQEVKKYVRGDGGYAIMSNGSEVSVSKRKKEEFLQHLSGH